MVNQLLAGVHIAAAAEAMALGIKAGADPAVLYDVISNSAGASWMFQNRVPHILAGDYTPHSAVDIFVKDLGIVLEAGKTARFPLPLTAAAHQMFMMAAAAGHGREDDSAVIKIFPASTCRAPRSFPRFFFRIGRVRVRGGACSRVDAAPHPALSSWRSHASQGRKDGEREKWV